jgi:2-polyprenyl-6-methoxyphenol hydroxylase-like FAD-dependent oxidoreductase
VVTLKADEAPEWLALDDAAFGARVQAQLGGRLGSVRMVGARHHYPLVAVYAHRFAASRFALIGDAAVGMHPVTAHGYNFGLYGVEVLAAELAQAAQAGRDLGDEAALQAYAREHQRITWPIYLGTNVVVKLFTNDQPAAKLAREAIVRATNLLPPIKAAVTRQLTGDRMGSPWAAFMPAFVPGLVPAWVKQLPKPPLPDLGLRSRFPNFPNFPDFPGFPGRR